MCFCIKATGTDDMKNKRSQSHGMKLFTILHNNLYICSQWSALKSYSSTAAAASQNFYSFRCSTLNFCGGNPQKNRGSGCRKKPEERGALDKSSPPRNSFRLPVESSIGLGYRRQEMQRHTEREREIPPSRRCVAQL